jgi:PII-like signaling protein
VTCAFQLALHARVNPLKIHSFPLILGQTDLWGTGSLYEAIVRRLRQLGLAGATAQVGMMGFGSHGKVHRKRLFGVSDDKPVIVTVVDNEHKIREVLPEIRGMVKEGLVVLLDAEVVEPLDAAE